MKRNFVFYGLILLLTISCTPTPKKKGKAKPAESQPAVLELADTSTAFQTINQLIFKDFSFELQTVGAGSLTDFKIIVSYKGKQLYEIDKKDTAPVTNVFIRDLNGNGNPELLLTTQSAGSGSYGDVIAYEFTKDTFTEIQFPELSEKNKTGYMGHDFFFPSGTMLFREFPVYGPEDSNCCPKGGNRIVTYVLSGHILKEKESENIK